MITQSLRVLVVDDEALARHRLCSLLAKVPDIEIVGECENGLEAVASIRESQPDLVFLDVQMPELDGLEATRQIRARLADNGPRIVAITANVMEGDREACFAAGMDDYVGKPIRVHELLAALERTPARAAG